MILSPNHMFSVSMNTIKQMEIYSTSLPCKIQNGRQEITNFIIIFFINNWDIISQTICYDIGNTMKHTIPLFDLNTSDRDLIFSPNHRCLLSVNAMKLLLPYFEIRIMPEKRLRWMFSSIHNKAHRGSVKGWPWYSGKCCLTVTSKFVPRGCLNNVPLTHT